MSAIIDNKESLFGVFVLFLGGKYVRELTDMFHMVNSLLRSDRTVYNLNPDPKFAMAGKLLTMNNPLRTAFLSHVPIPGGEYKMGQDRMRGDFATSGCQTVKDDKHFKGLLDIFWFPVQAVGRGILRVSLWIPNALYI